VKLVCKTSDKIETALGRYRHDLCKLIDTVRGCITRSTLHAADICQANTGLRSEDSEMGIYNLIEQSVSHKKVILLQED